MQQFERDYVQLVASTLENGEIRETRNGMTESVFGRSITVPVGNVFPLIQGRKMYPNGILGEYAALLRRPSCVEDFTKWGCNYWDLWADDNGKLIVDYGNSWFDFDGYDQIAELKRCLRDDPTNRRMIINSWRPNRLDKLSLPCCHYSYQFYVENGKTLHMVWTQRSVDLMIGLPSDFVLGAVMLISIAREFNLQPGSIKFDLGDCHVYQEHREQAMEYCESSLKANYAPVLYTYSGLPGEDFCNFRPDWLSLGLVESGPAMQFLLKE